MAWSMAKPIVVFLETMGTTAVNPWMGGFTDNFVACHRQFLHAGDQLELRR